MTKLRPKDLSQVLFELTEGKDEKELKIVLKNFVALLAKKQMLGSVGGVIDGYSKLYNKAHGITQATVTLISRLDPDTRIKLREALKKKHNAREVHMLEKVDARLLGGIKVRVGDIVYDSSLKNTLNQLEAKLTA